MAGQYGITNRSIEDYLTSLTDTDNTKMISKASKDLGWMMKPLMKNLRAKLPLSPNKNDNEYEVQVSYVSSPVGCICSQL